MGVPNRQILLNLPLPVHGRITDPVTILDVDLKDDDVLASSADHPFLLCLHEQEVRRFADYNERSYWTPAVCTTCALAGLRRLAATIEPVWDCKDYE